MVNWIKDYIKQYDKYTLYGVYQTSESEEFALTVMINNDFELLTYTLDPTSPKVIEYISENLEKLLAEAVVVIYHPKKQRSMIVEDASGIYRIESDKLFGKYKIIDIDNHYSKSYNEVISNLKNKRQFCNSNIFFTRITKKENRYTLKEALDYLKSHPEEFAVNERAKAVIINPVISVSTPDITRKTGNDNVNTFDFVTVELLLRYDLNIQDIQAYVKEHLQMLNKSALKKIAVNKKYQSFGIPVEYLTLYSIGTHMKTGVRMMYELRMTNNEGV